MNPIKKLIKDKIKEKKMTQKQLAEAIGVHYMTLQLWLHGHANPTLFNLRKLDEVLELNLTIAEAVDLIKNETN